MTRSPFVDKVSDPVLREIFDHIFRQAVDTQTVASMINEQYAEITGGIAPSTPGPVGKPNPKGIPPLLRGDT